MRSLRVLAPLPSARRTMAQYPSQPAGFEEGPKNPLKGTSMKPLVSASYAQSGVDAVGRRFDAAAHKGFLGKGDFFADPGIVQCDFLRVRQKNEVVSLHDAAVLGVHLVGILLLRGVEL